MEIRLDYYVPFCSIIYLALKFEFNAMVILGNRNSILLVSVIYGLGWNVDYLLP